MDGFTRRRLSPAHMLRPRRAVKFARNTVIFYLLARSLRRPINPGREALRRRYAQPRSRGSLGRLFDSHNR